MWQVIDIAKDDYYLTIKSNHLILRHNDDVIAQLFLKDICAVIYYAHRGTISLPLMRQLAEHKIPLIICDDKFMPTMQCLGISGYYQQTRRIAAQAKATESLKRKLWRQIIKQKITEQARSLQHHPNIAYSLKKIAKQVNDGDPHNYEAQAAKIMWVNLFGDDFRRDISATGLNAALNYGYIILRSAMARAIISTGLSPSLGLFHHNQLNPFCLVDDMMEPFRPLIDRIIAESIDDFKHDLTAENKSILANIINAGVMIDGEEISIQRYMHKICSQLAQIYLNERRSFDFVPIEISSQHAFRL